MYAEAVHAKQDCLSPSSLRIYIVMISVRKDLNQQGIRCPTSQASAPRYISQHKHNTHSDVACGVN